MRQVLLKLTDNALKFTERGLVDIRLEITRRRRPRMVRFTVTDTGLGVAPEMARHLFDPSRRGTSPTPARNRAPGLGLAVAKRIVEQAGGQIGFESKPGEGAQFFFTLPVSGAWPAGRAARAGKPAAPPSGLFPAALSARQRTGLALDRPCSSHSATASTVADSLAEAMERAGKENFDAIIASADDADMLAAAPGVKAPLVAVLMRGDRTPPPPTVLRWPVETDRFTAR